MFILIESYINKMSINDLNNFALRNNVQLDEEELTFTYNFVKKNWQSVLTNFNLFDFSKYKQFYSEENYLKIQQLIKEYTVKYSRYLK